MKYNPEFSPVRHIEWNDKEKFGEYLSLVKLNLKNRDKHYQCTICEKTFLTELGAWNHVDFKHPEKVIEIARQQKT